jgi:hypothetical protein
MAVAENTSAGKLPKVKRPDRRRAEAALWRAAQAEGRASVPIMVMPGFWLPSPLLVLVLDFPISDYENEDDDADEGLAVLATN